jgi:hypothetical protein
LIVGDRHNDDHRSCDATSHEIPDSALDDSHWDGEFRQPSHVGKVVDSSGVVQEWAK